MTMIASKYSMWFECFCGYRVSMEDVVDNPVLYIWATVEKETI